MHTTIRSVSAAAVLALCVAPAAGQEVFTRIVGRVLGVNLTAMAPAGDLNADGVMDMVVGGSATCGYVQVLSLLTGEGVTPPNFGVFNSHLGATVAGGGDFNGDGIPDYIAGAPLAQIKGGGAVFVFSGRNGEVLFTLTDGYPYNELGFAVAFLGDVNQDGFDDIAATPIHGQVRVHLGPKGKLLRIHNHYSTRPSVAGVGDVNGDGAADYVIGWPQANHKGVGFAGRADLISGFDGTILHKVFGSKYSDHLGRSVAGTGDVDGDGVPDFAAGAPGELEPYYGPRHGYVRVYSGATGARILEVQGPGTGNFGHSMAAGGDVNGDGVGDLVVGAPNDPKKNAGSVSIVSGRTGALLWRVRVRPDSYAFAYSLAMFDDLDGDGFSEFAALDRFNPQSKGRITVYRGGPGDVDRVCQGAPNSVGSGARLATRGPISTGNNELALTVRGAPPGQTGHFFYGPESASLPFGDGVLCIGGGATGLVRLGQVTLDSAGEAVLPVDFRTGPIAQDPGAWTAGSTWYVQFWYRDPGGPGGSGFNLSDALRITFTQ